MKAPTDTLTAAQASRMAARLAGLGRGVSAGEVNKIIAKGRTRQEVVDAYVAMLSGINARNRDLRRREVK